MNEPTCSPRLLVSVRNVAEASKALAGGCDVLDIKEPAHGSLGMAEPQRIGDIVSSAAKAPLSAALGEAVDWLHGANRPRLPAGLTFAKLGMAGMNRLAKWANRWTRLRDDIERQAGTTFHWIAVAYADWPLAEAPQPEAVIEAAGASGCAGVLFDTWSKTAETLLDWLPPERLAHLAGAIHREQMLVAVAGRLKAEQLARLTPLRPEVVAVRSAVCRDTNRSAPIAVDAVRAFHGQMTAVFSSAEPALHGRTLGPEVAPPQTGQLRS